jgi:uncharacterized RDD family membrane protein YckC
MNEPHYANFWWRLLAVIVDSLILMVPSCLVGLVLGVMAAIVVGEDADAASNLISGLGNLAGIVMSWLYYALLESSPMQATLGKKICGLRVTDLNGERLSFGRATGRFFARIVSGIPCMIGYLFPFFTEKKQALHDMIAGTLVIRPES